MNSNLKAIQQRDEQIKQLSKIRKDGSYIGAGLKFEIQVGMDGEVVNFDLGASTDLMVILDTLINGLNDSRKVYAQWARNDLNELKVFFGE